MGVTVEDDALLRQASRRNYDIIREAEQALADVEALVSRMPSSVSIKWGLIESPFSKYDVSQDKLEVYLFPNLFDLKYGKGSVEERDTSMRSMFNHEFLEPIKFSPAGDSVKRFLIAGACAFTSLVGESGFDQEHSELFNTPDAIRLMVDHVSQDIRVDRPLLKHLPHYSRGFSLSQRQFIAADWTTLGKLQISKNNGKFLINMNPYRVVHCLVPAIRRSVIMEEVRTMPNRHENGYFGRFTTFVKDWVISRKVKYLELQEPMYRIYDEFALPRHNKAKITRLAIDFVESFDNALTVPA